MGESKLSGKWYHLPWKEGSSRGLYGDGDMRGWCLLL